jgi:c(7)-type cytochrome triheme protein
MKRVSVICLSILALAAIAVWMQTITVNAEEAVKQSQEVIKIDTPKMKKSTVTFTHKEHADRLEGKCDTCHPEIVQELNAEGNTMKNVHKVCKTCHSKEGEAKEKSSCTSCHVVPAAE